MSVPDDDPLSKHGCKTLFESSESRVVIQRDLLAQYDGLEGKMQDRLLRVMKLWCNEMSMTKEMFNGNEGRSGNGTMLKAFKTFKHRLYGFERTLDQVRTFIIVDCDPAKKRDLADPNILKRAKGRVDAFVEGK